MTEKDTQWTMRSTEYIGKSLERIDGMTLRDWFAGMAMQGLMDAAIPMPKIAQDAYQMADQMLKARSE